MEFGDTAILHSPMQSFDTPTMVSFLLEMYTDEGDVTTEFHVYVTWQGRTFSPIISFNTSQSGLTHGFCMPPGEYSLTFVFSAGYSSKPSVSLDDVRVEPIVGGTWNVFATENRELSLSQEEFVYLNAFLKCDVGGFAEASYSSPLLFSDVF